MTANNFDWVNNQSVIQTLGMIYNSYCNSRELYCNMCLLSESIPDEITSCPWEDVKLYFQWVRKAQGTLHFWQNKFTTGSINYDEVMSYASSSNSMALNALGRAVCAGSCVMEMDSITQVKDTFCYNFAQLNIYLLRYVPGHPEVKYCTLSSLLCKYSVALPPNVQDVISKHVIYPNDHLGLKKQKLANVIPPPHTRVFEPGQDIVLNLTPELTLSDLQKLNEELSSFLEPLNDSLDMLVFFHLYQSEMFEKHLLKGLQSIVEPGLLQSSESANSVIGRGLTPVPSEMTSKSKEKTDKMYQDIPLRSLQTALEGVRDLLMRIIQGTATYSDIIAGDAINLKTINIEKEFSTLQTFSETMGIDGNGLNGIKSMLELFQFTQHIQAMDAVFEQYGLENCRSDPALKKLLEIVVELRSENSRAKLTPLDAITKMKLIKESLCLQGATSYKFLDLFSVVAKIQFLDPIIFRQQYQLLTEQLKCDENLLNYLHVTLEFLLPFVESGTSFRDLMSHVSQFDAKYELKQLDDNITLFRQWLLKAKVSRYVVLN